MGKEICLLASKNPEQPPQDLHSHCLLLSKSFLLESLSSYMRIMVVPLSLRDHLVVCQKSCIVNPHNAMSPQYLGGPKTDHNFDNLEAPITPVIHVFSMSLVHFETLSCRMILGNSQPNLNPTT